MAQHREGFAGISAFAWMGQAWIDLPDSQADFAVGAGNTISFPRSTTALCHSHPHWQRTESHNLGFLRSALHIAHDLIHMILTHLYCADWSKTVSPRASCAFSDEPVFPATHKLRRRQDFNALFLVFSVCSGLIRLEMAPTCGALNGVNGTAVPECITFRPFSTNFDSYRFGGAGGWALQRVVTRLNDPGSTPSPPVQREYRRTQKSCIVDFACRARPL